MTLIRTFFAIPIDKRILNPILVSLEVLKEKLGNHVTWNDPRDWHITLRFLGDTNHEQRRTLIEAARYIARETVPGSLHIKKLATFPLPTSKHLALHLIPSVGLKSLADKLEGAALAVGLNRNLRRFRPHITLGKFVQNPDPLMPIQFDHFDIPFEELVLYASQVQSDGAHYRALQNFKFHTSGEVNE